MKYWFLIIMVFLFLPPVHLTGQILLSESPQGREEDIGMIEIQAGAFRVESNAVALKSRIVTLLDQDVFMITEDGYFKIRISGFKTADELEKTISALGFLGLGKIWIRHPKKQISDISDTIPEGNYSLPVSVKIDSAGVPEKMSVKDSSRIVLLVGIFHEKSDALQARKRIESKLKHSVIILQEWEYYKVLVSGFNSVEETAAYYPMLAKLGYPDILLIKNY
jgi:hypothetical protein